MLLLHAGVVWQQRTDSRPGIHSEENLTHYDKKCPCLVLLAPLSYPLVYALIWTQYMDLTAATTAWQQQRSGMDMEDGGEATFMSGRSGPLCLLHLVRICSKETSHRYCHNIWGHEIPNI